MVISWNGSNRLLISSCSVLLWRRWYHAVIPRKTVTTCRLNNVDPKALLPDILARIGDCRV